MPSVQDSSNPDMQGWSPVNAPTQQTQQPQLPSPLDRSPFMIAAMPSSMSSGDLVGSQFYPNVNVPTQRILPVRGGEQ